VLRLLDLAGGRRTAYGQGIERHGQSNDPSGSNSSFAVVEQIGEKYVAFCPELPGTQARGTDYATALDRLREMAEKTLAERRERGIRDAPKGAEFDTIQLEGQRLSSCENADDSATRVRSANP
jgi:predicted RNase H-like HicB family nuclease